jgi:hypothetical protein
MIMLNVATLVVAACDDDYTGPEAQPLPEATVLTASGDVTARVTEFRTLLGEPANGGAAGEQPTGRREINWDGAGANPFNNRNDFPGDFFNTNVRTGAVFVTNGSGFRNDSTLFSEIDATYADQFSFFSANRIFSPVGSARMDVLFRVAGDTAQATVDGFGIVFTDVDRAGAARIQPFDQEGRSLGVYDAPVRSDANGLSFVGVKFDEAIIANVRIFTGEAAIAPGIYDVSAGGASDLVVVDNLLFGEPRAMR